MLATTAFAAGVTYVLLFAPVTQIQDIRVVHTARIDAAALATAIDASLDGTVLRFLARRNFFVVRSSDIAALVRRDVRVRDVRVTKIFPDGVEVDVAEHTLFPVWCVQQGASCYVLRDGCIAQSVDPSSDVVRDNPSIIIHDVGHDVVTQGACVATSEELERMAYMGSELVYTLDTRIADLYRADFRGGREVTYTTEEGWTVTVDLARDPNDTLATLRLFMATVMSDKNRGDIVYVDVRFPEKIFYKMKNALTVQTEPIATDSAVTEASPPKTEEKKTKKKNKNKKD